MSISIFDLFSIGIGPSSSHTVGPMRAAKLFISELENAGLMTDLARIKTELYGSLALTFAGHGTDKAIINGLMGLEPHTADPDRMIPNLNAAIENKQLHLANGKTIAFDFNQDFVPHRGEFLEYHSNAMRFSAYSTEGHLLLGSCYYSVGGGFIEHESELNCQTTPTSTIIPFPFDTGAGLLQHCLEQQKTIAEITLANELTFRTLDEINQSIHAITSVMSDCIARGCSTKGILPGGLNVPRRAAAILEKLTANQGILSRLEESDMLNRLNVFAMAVNEENAAGGRVVTAPTNGASGVMPAVIEYYKQLHKDSTEQGVRTFFLTAGAIGLLYKLRGSLSGAEVGCQGEVGVASSMAAGGLTAAIGGTPLQVENAAEIAMEHHLGMTCDPIKGLVQIPCIERNAMGAVKAVNAARLALIGDGQHHVSLDKVIQTMMQTGRDMMSIYKETSQGGLAVNVIEC